MATQTITTYIDDLTGEPADKSVTFALEGNTWEIDLSSEHIDALHEALSTFIEHGRPVRNSVKAKLARAKVDREQAQAMREWGRANGWNVSDRGRVPAALVEAYNTTSHSI